MRFNAHLLQSQGNVSDIGASQYMTVTSKWKVPTDFIGFRDSSDSNPLSGDEPAQFNQEVGYRYAFIDRVFSAKRKSGGYTAFYDGNYDSLVYPNELPTMGQISDFLFRKKTIGFLGGPLDRYYGDPITNDVLGTLFDDPNVYVPGTGLFIDGWSTDPLDTSERNLLQKLKIIFDKLFNMESAKEGFNVHAAGFYGGSFTTSENLTVNASIQNLKAGTDKQDATNWIFRVIGKSGGNPRRIQLIHSNDYDTDHSRPTGIEGVYSTTDSETPNTGDSFEDYFNGYYSFTDVTRYFLRNTSTNSHRFAYDGDNYLVDLAGGITNGYPTARLAFTNITEGGATYIYFPFPLADSSYVLTTKPLMAAMTQVTCYNEVTGLGFDYIYSFANTASYGGTGTNGLKVFGAGKSSIFRYLTAGSKFALRNGTWDTIFDFAGKKDGGGGLNASPNNPTDHHFLTSDATQRLYGTFGSGATAKFLEFDADVTGDTQGRRGGVGLYKYADTDIRFYAFNSNAGTEYRCKLPGITETDPANCDFVVTKPAAPQTITGGLTLTGTIAAPVGTITTLNVTTLNASGYGIMSVPIGTIIMSGVAPSGNEMTGRNDYLYCNGALNAWSVCPELRAVIGTSFGGVVNVSYNVPDMRGMFARGVKDGSSNDPDPRVGGNASGLGSTQTSAFKTTNTNSAFDALDIHNGGSLDSNKVQRSGNADARTCNVLSHAHTVNGGSTTETRPINTAVYFYIKAKSS